MASNLLTKHLHQQRDRIAGLLMPGAKIAPDQRLFSPLLPGFGGQKFRLAARKMRALDPARLGDLRLEQIRQPLIGPFNEARNLLHLKPAAQGGVSSTWSQVETVFPSAAAEPETPPAPGELRQGSIIPRMALVPTPGQSLESFKEQIQQRPKAPPPPAEPPKPQISPKSRLFTRIQEITATKNPEELPDGPPAEATIQRQPDFKQQAAPELSKKPEEVEKTTPLAELAPLTVPPVKQKTIRAEEHPGQPPAPQPESAPTAAAPASKDETVSLARAIPVPTRKTIPPERVLPRAVPTQKPPLTAAPHASPTQAQKPAVKARQIEQKAVQPAKPKTKVPHTPARQPSPLDAPPLPQPTPDSPTPVKKTPESKLFTTPVLPDITQPAPGSGPVIVSEPEAIPSSEMPLRKQATYRQQAPAKLKALTPQHVKPKIETPALVHPGKPLIPPQKYHPATPAVVARQPDEHPLLDFSRPAPMQAALVRPQPATTPQAQRAEPESNTQPAPTVSTKPVSMALAYPPRRAEQVPPTSPLPAAPPVTPPVEIALQKKPTPPTVESPKLPVVSKASVQNVIQRKWPENEGGPSSDILGNEPAAEQSSVEQAQPELDLARLAEDVFPYVKRLIEIESDRISSRFH